MASLACRPAQRGRLGLGRRTRTAPPSPAGEGSSRAHRVPPGPPRLTSAPPFLLSVPDGPHPRLQPPSLASAPRATAEGIFSRTLLCAHCFRVPSDPAPGNSLSQPGPYATLIPCDPLDTSLGGSAVSAPWGSGPACPCPRNCRDNPPLRLTGRFSRPQTTSPSPPQI